MLRDQEENMIFRGDSINENSANECTASTRNLCFGVRRSGAEGAVLSVIAGSTSFGFMQYVTGSISINTGSGRYIGGEEVTCFEDEFAAYEGAKYGISCGNGTDAIVLQCSLWLALFRVSYGIIKKNTFIYFINSICETRKKSVG